MRNYRRDYSKLTLDDMENEFVRLVRALLQDQRHESKTHNALEVKRLLVLMIDLYRKGESNINLDGQLKFE